MIIQRLHVAFLQFCLWQIDFELAIARETSGNTAWIAELSQRSTRMAGFLHQARVNYVV